MKKFKICLGLIILIAGIIISSKVFAAETETNRFNFGRLVGDNEISQELGTSYAETYKITRDGQFSKTLKEGDTLILKITNTNGATWSATNSGKDGVISVIGTSKQVTVTANHSGTATIYAKAKDGSGTYTYNITVKQGTVASSTPNTSNLLLTIDGQKCASALDMYVGNVKTIITNKNVTWKKTVDGNATTYYNNGTSCKITAVRAGIDKYEVTDGTSKVIVQISVNNTSPAVSNANILGNYVDVGGYRVWAKIGPRKELQDVTNKICTINQSIVSTAGTVFGIYLVPLNGTVTVNPNIYANSIPVSITAGDSSKVGIIVDNNLHGWAYGGGQSSNCLEITATVIGKASTNGTSIPIYITLNGQKIKLFSIKVSNTVNEVKLTGSSNLRLNVESGKSQIEVGKDAGLTLSGYTGVWQPDGISTKIVWSSNNQSVISILHPELQTSTWNTAKAVGVGTATVTARIYAYDTKTRAQLRIKIADGQYVDYFEVSGNITVTAATTQNNPSNPNTPSAIHTSKVTLSQEKIDLKIGDTTVLVATKYPSNSEDSITWKSSNTAVATVDLNGNVKAIAEGSAIITVQSGNYAATCIVTVTKKQEDPVEINKYEIEETEKIIRDIPNNTNIEKLITNLSTTSEIIVKDNKGNIITDKTKLIGTGYKIIIGTKEYTAVVSGDLNGDGEIGALDLLKFIKDILDIEKLEGAYKEAADINADEKVNAKDLIQIIELILE